MGLGASVCPAGPLWSAVAVFQVGRAFLLRAFSEEELTAFLNAPDEGLDVDAIGWAILGLVVAAVVVPLLTWAVL